MNTDAKYLIILTDGLLDYEATRAEINREHLSDNYTATAEKIWANLLTLEEVQSAVKEVMSLQIYKLKRIESYLPSSPPHSLSIFHLEGEADGYIEIEGSGFWLTICRRTAAYDAITEDRDSLIQSDRTCIIVGTNEESELIGLIERRLSHRNVKSILLRFDDSNDLISPSYNEVINALTRASRVLVCLGQENTDIGFVISQAVMMELSTTVFVRSGNHIDPVIREIEDENFFLIEYQELDQIDKFI